MGKDKKSTELSCPGIMEITEKERMGVPTEEAIAKQKTLSEKLKDHYHTKKAKRNDVLKNVLTPEFINSFAVPVYLFTVISSWKIAFFDVMPVMYAGNDRVIFWQQVLSVVLLFEIMVNWLGIRYVDSSYTRCLRVQQEEKEKKERDPYQNMLTQQVQNKEDSDSSCAKLLPVNMSQDGVKENQTKDDHAHNENSKSSPDSQRVEDSPAHQLTLAAAKANSEMEKKNEQMKSIADLIASANEQTAKTGSSRSSRSKSRSKEKQKMGPVSQEAVKSPTPKVSKSANTITYPYWSWIPCFDCNCTRPPRCHHCPICKTCILKRDHHCFFAGNCVGYRNHRFFYVFLLWAWVCSIYSTAHGFPYIYMFLWDKMSYFDVFFPITIVRWLLGYGTFQAALCVTTLTILIYFDLLTSTFIYTHGRLITWGLTSFEKAFLKRTLEIKDNRKLDQKLRAVFGRNWLLNIIIPVSWIYEVEEDPVEWPHIQVIKHKP